MSNKVHLVLGSGGARGIAHIGIIEMLLADGFDIASITGCSMGAVVGGMFCAGSLPLYKEWLCTLTKTSVFSLFDFTLTTQGFVKGNKVLNKLKELAGDQEIEKLPIPFTAVATDMVHKKEVHFSSGNLFTALRASICIPGVFTPVEHGQHILVDGGVLNPLPLNIVHKKEGEKIVAVNINGSTVAVDEDGNPAKPSLSIINLLSNSYDLTQDRLTALMIELYPPDLLIEIPRNTCTVFEFHRAAELIEVGIAAYKKNSLKADVPV
ncbi:MAG: patatin-like phospholipase family protein [Bacteroidetes bacterium]|nr:patatin-like phospholipase family protein [Bacteroidota bacterium]